MSTKEAVEIKRPFSNSDKLDKEVVALACASDRGGAQTEACAKILLDIEGKFPREFPRGGG
jgi:hypothetical protein